MHDACVTSTAGPSWSDIAAWYDELVAGGSGPHETAVCSLLSLVPELTGQIVLDLACGQGLATRALAEAGAQQVVGIDASSEMISIAREHGAPAGSDVAYLVDDAQELATVGTATFDGASCQLGLMDIPDLDSTLAALRRVLKPQGWFVFVIGHPCFLVPDATSATRSDGRPAVTVSGYFEERFWRSSNPHGVRRAGNHHRTLATYLNSLVRAGFGIEAVEEPEATPLLAQQQPLYREVPIFFAARVRRT
jgi:SAM-dependent methyltransferase